MADRETKNPIKKPKRHKGSDRGRATARAVAGVVPYGGAALSEISDALIPNPTAKDRERWEGEVTDEVNSLGVRVEDIDERTGRRKVEFSGVAAEIAKLMIEGCPDAMCSEGYSVEDLGKELTDYTSENIEDALGDLESYGLLESINFLNAPSQYRLEEQAYKVLDPPIMGWNPENDAKAIAAHLTKNRIDNVSVPELEKAMNWPRRRFNPALRIILSFIHPGRISQEIQPYWPTTSYFMTNAEMAELRRFAKEA